MASALTNLGYLAHAAHGTERAEALFEDGLAHWRELGDARGTAFAFDNLGVIANDQDDHARAQALFDESLTLAWASIAACSRCGVARASRTMVDSDLPPACGLRHQSGPLGSDS